MKSVLLNCCLYLCFAVGCTHLEGPKSSATILNQIDTHQMSSLLEIKKSQVRQFELLDEPIWGPQLSDLRIEVADLESALRDAELQNMLEQ